MAATVAAFALVARRYELFAEEPAPATSLDRVLGPDRNLALIRSNIDQSSRSRTATTRRSTTSCWRSPPAACRGLLRSRGEPVEDLIMRIYVPATLPKPQQRAQARENLGGDLVVPLPIGVSDPGRRLQQIAAETAKGKARSRPSLGTMLRNRIARRALLKVLDRQPVSVTADVPGPRTPLYLAGARLLEVFPLLPLIASVSLGVGALSYAGQFNIMAVADQDACPDLDVFATSAQDELLALTAPTRVKPDRHEQR
jgi:diacylglycerol O-acyltransferase / wax synthase